MQSASMFLKIFKYYFLQGNLKKLKFLFKKN